MSKSSKTRRDSPRNAPTKSSSSLLFGSPKSGGSSKTGGSPKSSNTEKERAYKGRSGKRNSNDSKGNSKKSSSSSSSLSSSSSSPSASLKRRNTPLPTDLSKLAASKGGLAILKGGGGREPHDWMSGDAVPQSEAERAEARAQQVGSWVLKEAVEKAHSIYTLLDTNGSGYLEAEELAQGAEILSLTKAQAEQLFRELDTGNKGRLNQEDFATGFLSRGLRKSPKISFDEIRWPTKELFDALDTDGNHFLEPKEFVAGAEVLGLTRQQAERLFYELDSGLNGRLELKHFTDGFASAKLSFNKIRWPTAFRYKKEGGGADANGRFDGGSSGGGGGGLFGFVSGGDNSRDRSFDDDEGEGSGVQTLWSMAGGGDKTRGEDGDNDEKKNGAGRGGESSSALVPAQMLRSKSKQQKSQSFGGFDSPSMGMGLDFMDWERSASALNDFFFGGTASSFFGDSSLDRLPPPTAATSTPRNASPQRAGGQQQRKEEGVEEGDAWEKDEAKKAAAAAGGGILGSSSVGAPETPTGDGRQGGGTIMKSALSRKSSWSRGVTASERRREMTRKSQLALDNSSSSSSSSSSSNHDANGEGVPHRQLEKSLSWEDGMTPAKARQMEFEAELQQELKKAAFAKAAERYLKR